MRYYVQKTLRVADSQMTPRHVRTKPRMSSRYVRILAIKRSGGKTTLYHPSSPRRDPHDVTPQNYPKTGERFTGRTTAALLTALVAIASKTAANWGKVPRVYRTPPHISTPTGCLSLLLVWVWVGGFQNSLPLRTLEAKWRHR